MVWADELSIGGILRGLREGRTVVRIEGSEGPMIEMDLEGERIGDTVMAERSVLRARVTGGVGSMLHLVRNGLVVEEIPIDSDPFFDEAEVIAPASGEDRYRIEVVEGGRPRAIVSHVWLSRP